MNLKGVIVAAGYGTRFLPATKTVAKEMLPLIDRPAISFIVEEFLAAGIRDILIITSRRKKCLDDFFDHDPELEHVLARAGKTDALAAIEPANARFCWVRQREMRGTGEAILLARTFTGGDPFIVAYPDDLVFHPVSLSLQLADAYRQTGASLLAVQEKAGSDLSRYGVADPAGEGNPCPIRALVEKPAAGKQPSNLVSYGRYLFTPAIYPHLERGLAKHPGGEYYHVSAINGLAADGQMWALAFQGLRLDTGEPMGYLEAVCRYALTRPEWRVAAQSLFASLAETAPPD